MNAATLRSKFYCALAVLAMVMLQPAVSVAAEWDIDQLMQLLSKAKQSHATFVETKYIAMLERPLKSSGELLYTAPDNTPYTGWASGKFLIDSLSTSHQGRSFSSTCAPISPMC